MSANLGLLTQKPLLILGFAVALLVIKFLLLYVIARVGGDNNETAQRLAIGLAQGGEFAFVLFAAAQGLGIFAADISQLLVVVVTISMLLAPLTFMLHDRLFARWLESRTEPEYDTINEPGNPVIIAGYGRFGQIVSRILRMCGIPFTALDISYQQVDFVRRFGNKIYYGDASRLELLHAAKAGEANLFVLAIDDVEASVKTAALVRTNFPALPILARARNRVHYFRLRDLGIKTIWRETFPASLEVASQALLRSGLGVAEAERAIAIFKRHDEEQLEAQYAVNQDEELLIQTSKQAADQLKELFESDVMQPLTPRSKRKGRRADTAAAAGTEESSPNRAHG
jgi:glutathione-regulated potassium-efflux system ancillary protein KefC/glutathione-regulated potassium-efflux system protein KefB